MLIESLLFNATHALLWPVRGAAAEFLVILLIIVVLFFVLQPSEQPFKNRKLHRLSTENRERVLNLKVVNSVPR
jgi:hypothetical protein